MKAQKKPVIIDYFEINNLESTIQELKDWIESFGENSNNILNEHWWGDKEQFLDLSINTLEGTSYNVDANYVIIRGIKGEFYPCEKSIFEQTYDKL